MEATSPDLLKLAVALIAAAYVVERFVEHYVVQPITLKWPDWAGLTLVIPTVALLLGIAVSFGFQFNLPAALKWSGAHWVGVLFTGVLVGFGSNFVSDFIERFLKAPVNVMRKEVE